MTSDPLTPADLAALPLFEGIPDAELEILAAASSREVFQDGDTLFKQDAPTSKVMSIVRGQVVLRSTMNERSTIVQTIGTRELLGWSSLRDDARALTTARASGEVEVVAFPAERLLDLMTGGSSNSRVLIRRLFGIAAGHLQETRMQLHRAGREGVITGG